MLLFGLQGISLVVNLLRFVLLPDDVADWPEMVYVLEVCMAWSELHLAVINLGIHIERLF